MEARFDSVEWHRGISVSCQRRKFGFPEVQRSGALSTYTVVIPLRAPIANVVLTLPENSGHCLATSPSSISKVVKRTAEFIACLPTTGAVPLQKTPAPSFFRICRIVLVIPEFPVSVLAFPASIILVFSASAGVTTRTDSATPAVIPDNSVVVVALKAPNVLSHSLLLENAKNLIEDFRALLLARAVQPAYSPGKPCVLIVERRREKEDGRVEIPLSGSWRLVLRSSKGYYNL